MESPFFAQSKTVSSGASILTRGKRDITSLLGEPKDLKARLSELYDPSTPAPSLLGMTSF